MPSSREAMATVRAGDAVVAAFPSALSPRTDPSAEARLSGFRAGRDEGFEVGLAEGRRAAEASFGRVLQSLEGIIADAEDRNRRNEERLEALALELAVELAEAIVGGSLSLVENGDDVIARAMHLRRVGEPVRIRVHPDHASLADPVDHPGVEVVADPQLPVGAAEAELGEGLADISIATAVTRVREELGS